MKSFKEALKGKQHKLDKNKNGKLDAHDFKLLRKEEQELQEDHFKLGDKVKCKASGMTGKVVKLDEPSGPDDKEYYTVEREDGKTMKYAPKDLTLVKEGLKPGWMLKADPKLGAKVKANIDLAKKRQATHGDKSAGKSMKEEALDEEWEELDEAVGAHKVIVTVSDPQHTMVSKRKETIMKRVIVKASTKDEAHSKAAAHYKKQGYKVHGTEYHSAQPSSTMKTEEVDQIDEVAKATGDLKDACWKGYTAVGMKKKNGKDVPNCVPVKEATEKEEDKFHKKLDKLVHKTFGHSSDEKKMKEEVDLEEKMDMSKADMGDVIKDFQKSDAPQFAGKSKEKRREMAIAAKLSADRQKNEGMSFLAYHKLMESAEVEIIELDEMISYSDFTDKMNAHKKAGNRIVDYKYDDKKAHYTVVDKEGTARKVIHTARGTQMQNLGNVKGDDSDESPKAEKRGRGRPKGSKSGASGPRIK